jgi:hypothetical protein
LEILLGWKKALENIQVYLGSFESKLIQKLEYFDKVKNIFHDDEDLSHCISHVDDTDININSCSILLIPRYDISKLFSFHFELQCRNETIELMIQVSNLLYSQYEMKDYNTIHAVSLDTLCSF